jgi:biotin transport system substrate-specific component
LHSTVADVFIPTTKIRALGYHVGLVLAGTLLLTLSSKTSITLPFSPVPVTMQTCAVLLLGALLGSKWGSLTVCAYLIEGCIGLPVFARGGSGIAYLLGPTGGYLLGFIVAAYITGSLAERGWDRKFGTTLLAMLIGNAALFSLGIFWLSGFVGIENALMAGVVPFIAGELVKMAAAGALLPTGWKVLKRFNMA